MNHESRCTLIYSSSFVVMNTALQREKIILMMSYCTVVMSSGLHHLGFGDDTFVTERLCYKLEALSIKDLGIWSDESCIMGNVGSIFF